MRRSSPGVLEAVGGCDRSESLLARINIGAQFFLRDEGLTLNGEDHDAFGAWAKAKAAEIVRRLTQLVTGEQVRGARADRRASAADWVHPLLRFVPAPADPGIDHVAAAEQLEAAE